MSNIHIGFTQCQIFFLIGFLTLSSHLAEANQQEYLTNIQKLTHDNNSIAPVFSPSDNTLLAFTRQKYQGIYLLHTANTRSGIRAFSADNNIKISELTDNKQAGFAFSWSQEGTTIVARFEKTGKKQAGAININSKKLTELSAQVAELSVPTVHNTGIFFMQDEAEVKLDLSANKLRSQAVSGDLTVFEKAGNIVVNNKNVNFPKTECWLPTIAPDGLKVSFECWQGVYVYDIKNNRTIYLGKGGSVSWFPNSQQLVYETTQDNGVMIVSADIMLVNYDGTHSVNLTASTDMIVRRPSISPDNQQVAFDDGTNIYVADLILRGN